RSVGRGAHEEGRRPVGQSHPARGRNSMAAYYPIVIETETTGAVSAYVPGLPVYAAADTRAKAERAILKTLAAYLDVHPTTSPTTRIRVARVSDDPKWKVHVVASLVGVGALLGTGRSVHKA